MDLPASSRRGGATRVRGVLAGLIAACPLGALLAGCVAPQQHDDLRHQYDKAIAERDDARRRLDDERALNAALREQLAASTRRDDAARSEVERARARVEELAASNRELQALVEKHTGRALERPQAVAVPLPPRADAALLKLGEASTGLLSYDRERGAVRFTGDVLFPAGSDVLSDAARPALAALARVATSPEVAGFEVIVVGRTDDAPITKAETRARHATNWHLSVHRAIAVKDALVEAGVPGSRVGVMGYGPAPSGGAGRAGDRRVDVYLVREGDVRPLGGR